MSLIKTVMYFCFVIALRGTQLLIRYLSRNGRQPFFENDQFTWVKTLEDNWESVHAELSQVLRNGEYIPNIQDVSREQYSISSGSNWKSFFFFIWGEGITKNCADCPNTARLLKQIPGMKTALFSILAPGTHIPEHRGLFNGLIRCHLALIVPQDYESCRIHVNQQERHWLPGKCFVFDDTYPHQVWNDTDERRVVLIIDIVRELPWPLSLLNTAMLKVLERTSMVQRPIKLLNDGIVPG